MRQCLENRIEGPETLLTGGVQPVRVVLRALALRQLGL
jgi:hypothetical protein